MSPKKKHPSIKQRLLQYVIDLEEEYDIDFLDYQEVEDAVTTLADVLEEFKNNPEGVRELDFESRILNPEEDLFEDTDADEDTWGNEVEEDEEE